MRKTWKSPVVFMLISSGIILLLFLLMQPLEVLRFREYLDVLFPSGLIAAKEIDLLYIIQIAMLFIVIPVYLFTFIFSWKYRADNPKGTYDPDLIDNTLAEVIWWGLPLVLTVSVSILTWIKTHELDPYKPIPSKNKEITVQVVALQWKWLFIYPEENIASINYFQIPKNTPIKFEITADAPMNSFWLPALGGQIYAMPKMKTYLYLIANEEGDFRGSSANISGEGFAAMNFICRSSSEDNYRQWIENAKNSTNILNKKSYEKISKPSTNKPEIFKLSDTNLFTYILHKYMHPPKEIKTSK